MSEPTQDGLGALFNAPDAGNQGPGELLRRAREAQRISIEVMAANIKVSVNKLEALESGRFDLLPDTNFTRALAMTLCRVLKVDPGPVLAGLPAARPATLFSEVPPLNQPFKASRASLALFDRSSAVDWSAFLKPQWLAPAVLLLAAVVLYAVPGSSDWPERFQVWWRSHQTVASTAPSASAADADLPAAVPAPEPGSAAVVPEPVASASDAASAVAAPVLNANGSMPLKLDASDASSGVAPAAASAVPAPAGPVAAPPQPALASQSPPAPPAAAVANSLLNLRAREATWVEVKDAQGNRLLGRLLQRDESVDLSAPPPLTLRVGNAAGLQLSFKGQPVDLVPFTRNNIARLELK